MGSTPCNQFPYLIILSGPIKLCLIVPHVYTCTYTCTCMQMVNVGVLGQGVANKVLLVVQENVLTKTDVVFNVKEGDPFSSDLNNLLRSQVSSLR